MTVRDNAALSRFELDVEGGIAFANYRRVPGTVIITHTETPHALRGRGIASELVGGALELIRADRNSPIQPTFGRLTSGATQASSTLGQARIIST